MVQLLLYMAARAWARKCHVKGHQFIYFWGTNELYSAKNCSTRFYDSSSSWATSIVYTEGR